MSDPWTPPWLNAQSNTVEGRHSSIQWDKSLIWQTNERLQCAVKNRDSHFRKKEWIFHRGVGPHLRIWGRRKEKPSSRLLPLMLSEVCPPGLSLASTSRYTKMEDSLSAELPWGNNLIFLSKGHMYFMTFCILIFLLLITVSIIVYIKAFGLIHI